MNYGQQIAKVEAKRTGLMDAAGRAEDEMTRHESTCAQLDEAISILQAVGKEVQAIVHKRLADVVSRCLAAVFDDPYQIDIEFSAKRNRTEASITFVRDGQAVNPMTASGGGVVDVAAFALRIAAICLQYPAPRRLVVLDEPFRFLSEQYREAGRQILESLADEMDCQFILVTHIKELSAGQVIHM
jgi:DNA repair exonuclease SbcCD ATPase subunit